MSSRHLLTLLFVALLSGCLATAQQFITAPITITSSGSGDTISADLNRDGIPDLVLSGENLAMELGNGDGTFTLAQQFGGTFGRAVTGDWNADGVPDVAVIESPNLFVFLGIGDGTFQTGVQYGVSGLPAALATGDLNGDGIADLVTANFGGSINVLLGRQGGTFAAAVTYSLGDGDDAYDLALADFNGDGNLDVVTVQPFDSSSIAVLMGNGDGTLKKPTRFPSGGAYLTHVATDDFNHDGIPDLAATGADFLAVLLGKGNGTFQAPHLYGSVVSSGSLRIADINSDGNPDVLAVNMDYKPAVVAVSYGNADGSFQSSLLFGLSTFSPKTMAIADFNQDGRLDAIVGDGSEACSTFLIGQKGGGFRAWRSFFMVGPHQYGTQFLSLGIGYLNSDQNLDVALLDRTNHNVVVTFSRPDGTFSGPKLFPTVSDAQTLALADFNRDGKLDVVTDSKQGISVLLGRGNGDFANHVDYTGSSAGIFVLAADVNGDGNIDVLTANDSAKTVTAFLNDGSGHFSTHVDSSMHNNPFWLAAGDFNQDGKLDLVTANRGTAHAATILFGNGDGTFSVGQTFATPKSFLGVGGVATADFNSDGRLDFYLSSSGNLYVYLGNGDGTFQDPIENTGEYGGAIGDVNRDGILDLVGGTVLLGRGDGTFFSVQDPHLEDFTGAVGLGDFNHDGALDAVFTGDLTNTVDVLLNTGAR